MPPKKQQPEQLDLPEIAAPETEPTEATEAPSTPEVESPAEPVGAEGDDNPLRRVAIEAMVGAGLDPDTAELAYAAAQDAVMAYVNDHSGLADVPTSFDPSTLGTSGDICRECFGDGWASPNAKDFVSVGCVHGHWSRS